MEHKTLGFLGEMKFITSATEKGLIVSKPILDNYPFDFIVGDVTHKRVQVKTVQTSEKGRDGYRVMTSKGAKAKKKYNATEIDLFAIYLSDLDVWYIIPIDYITTHTIRLYPHREDKYAMFFEAWHLLQHSTH